MRRRLPVPWRSRRRQSRLAARRLNDPTPTPSFEQLRSHRATIERGASSAEEAGTARSTTTSRSRAPSPGGVFYGQELHDRIEATDLTGRRPRERPGPPPSRLPAGPRGRAGGSRPRCRERSGSTRPGAGWWCGRRVRPCRRAQGSAGSGQHLFADALHPTAQRVEPVVALPDPPRSPAPLRPRQAGGAGRARTAATWPGSFSSNLARTRSESGRPARTPDPPRRRGSTLGQLVYRLHGQRSPRVAEVAGQKHHQCGERLVVEPVLTAEQ